MEDGAARPLPGRSAEAVGRARSQVPYGLFLGIYVLLWTIFFVIFRLQHFQRHSLQFLLGFAEIDAGVFEAVTLCVSFGPSRFQQGQQ